MGVMQREDGFDGGKVKGFYGFHTGFYLNTFALSHLLFIINY